MYEMVGIKVTWNWYERCFYIGSWNMLLVWLGRNSMIVSWWCLIGLGLNSMNL